MALPPLALLLSLFFTLSFFLTSSSQTCSNYTFSSNQSFSSCADLPHLGASLHWTRSQSSAICIAFRAPQASDDGWVAWGVNPAGKPAMVGTQALVAHRGSNGAMAAYPTVLSSYSPSMRPAGKLAFPVYNVSAEYVGGDMIIFATLGLLGAGGGVADAKFSHVWQKGSSVVNGVPAVHSTSGENVLSMGSVEFH